MVILYGNEPQKQQEETDGFIAGIKKSLRAVPHLPDAITKGLNEPGISDEEKDLRKTALSDAAAIVIPAIATAGLGPIVAGLGAGGAALIASVAVEAGGLGAGMGLSAGIKGEDPVPAAMQGALWGAAFGGIGGLVGRGGKLATEAAGKAAAERAAIEQEAKLAKAAHGFTVYAQRELARGDAAAAQYAREGLGSKVVNEGGQLVLSSEPIRSTVPEQILPSTILRSTGKRVEPASLQDKHLFNTFIKAAGVPEGERTAEQLNTIRLAGEEIKKRGLQRNFAEYAIKKPVDQTLVATELASAPKTFAQTPVRVTVPLGQLNLLDDVQIAAVGEQMDMFGNVKKVSGQAFAGGVSKDAHMASALIGSDKPIISTLPEAKVPAISGGGKIAEAVGTFSPSQVIRGAERMAQEAVVTEVEPALLGMARKANRLIEAGTGANMKKAMNEATMLFYKAIMPARITLKALGPTGAKFAEAIDKALTNWRRGAGADTEKMLNILDPFNIKERHHIGEIMEGLAVPTDQKYLDAANQLQTIYAQYAQWAHDLGIKVMLPNGGIAEFMERRNYLTHYYDTKKLKAVLDERNPLHQQALDIMEKMGVEKDAAARKKLLHQWAGYPSEYRTGPINFHRTELFDQLGIPYEKDPRKVMGRYILDVRKRIELERLDKDAGGIKNIYDGIIADGGEAAVAKTVWDALNGNLPHSFSNLVKATSTYTTLTLLSTAGIVQPAQLLNVAARTSYSSMFKAIGILTSEMRKKKGEQYFVRWAEGAGAHIGEVVNDLLGTSDNPVTNFWLKKVIWLEPLDKANRVVAAIAGRLEAERVAAKFAVKPTAWGETWLRKAGINPAEVLAQKGTLTPDQLRLAGYRVSLDTQFASDVLDLPAFRNSDAGKLVYTFKPFAIQQTEWIVKDVLAPARAYLISGGKRGSLGPLTRYAAGLGPTGATIGNLVRSIKGRPAPDDPVLKTIDNLALVGGFGIFYDTLRAMEAGPDRLMAFFTGPAAGELTRFLAADIPSAIKGDPSKIARHLISRVPLIGQSINNYWLR